MLFRIYREPSTRSSELTVIVHRIGLLLYTYIFSVLLFIFKHSTNIFALASAIARAVDSVGRCKTQNRKLLNYFLFEEQRRTRAQTMLRDSGTRIT